MIDVHPGAETVVAFYVIALQLYIPLATKLSILGVFAISIADGLAPSIPIAIAYLFLLVASITRSNMDNKLIVHPEIYF